MNKPYLNLLGIAYRANKCSVGESSILRDIRAGRVKLLLIASDCSRTTKKRLIDKSNTFEVPYMEVDDRETLAQAIGKSARVAIAVLDQGFSKKLKSLLS